MYSLLAAGTSISTPSQPYLGFLPPPAYISLASSLVANPSLTKKTSFRDAIQDSDVALRYLRCVQATIDSSAYPAIRKAFAFPEERNRRRAPGNRSAAGSASPEPGGDIERIAGSAANEDALWYRAEDFWHIVGWAFNCSILHRKRWTRWKLWLGTILDFLEADWSICMDRSKASDASREAILQQSLLWQYIVGQAETINRSMRRHMIGAILAMATKDAQKDYPEVWQNETKRPRKRKDDKQPVGEVNFETGDMADYESDEEMQDCSEDQDEGDEAQQSSGILSNERVRNVHDAIVSLGGQEAIQLRHRILALVGCLHLIQGFC